MRVVYQPLVTGSLEPMDVARFAARVDLSGGREACWPWLGARQGNEYGRTAYRGRSTTAHRFSLELDLGRPIRPGLSSLHTCDNHGCVNPLHLYEGTHRQNMADMARRGRARAGRRYVPEHVEADVQRRLEAGEPKIRIAAAVGIRRHTVQRIARHPRALP